MEWETIAQREEVMIAALYTGEDLGKHEIDELEREIHAFLDGMPATIAKFNATTELEVAEFSQIVRKVRNEAHLGLAILKEVSNDASPEKVQNMFLAWKAREKA